MPSIGSYLKQRVTNSFASSSSNGSARIHPVNYILQQLGENNAVPLAASGGQLESVYTLPTETALGSLLSSLGADPNTIRVGDGYGLTDMGKTVTVGVLNSIVQATFQLVASDGNGDGLAAGGVGLTVTNVVRTDAIGTGGQANVARV